MSVCVCVCVCVFIHGPSELGMNLLNSIAKALLFM
jgi:hypothetical protein